MLVRPSDSQNHLPTTFVGSIDGALKSATEMKDVVLIQVRTWCNTSRSSLSFDSSIACISFLTRLSSLGKFDKPRSQSIEGPSTTLFDSRGQVRYVGLPRISHRCTACCAEVSCSVCDKKEAVSARSSYFSSVLCCSRREAFATRQGLP